MYLVVQFKTCLRYHTDVTGRILPTTTNSEEGERPEQPSLVNLQNIAAKVIIASRINFYAAEIPFRLKNYISDMVDTVNLCENCRYVHSIFNLFMCPKQRGLATENQKVLLINKWQKSY